MFLFGAPGDGKTAMAERIGTLLGDDIWLPYAVDVDGQVIKVYDPEVHQTRETTAQPGAPRFDARWVRCRRPLVISGGELSLGALDLRYDPVSRFYEAPLQMLANGGMYLIDDFGRQQVSPRELLNRWIVPLEKRVDYLSLTSGKKIAIPFHTLVVFSTNLEPLHLVDEAFLRRIRYKVHVSSPGQEQYREIFRRVCLDRGVPYVDAAVTYLFHEQYAKRRIPLRACHPRDLMEQLLDAANYLSTPAVLSKELLDQACDTYFVTPRISAAAPQAPRPVAPTPAVAPVTA
jgi:predicted ATPase with chaperone activity